MRLRDEPIERGGRSPLNRWYSVPFWSTGRPSCCVSLWLFCTWLLVCAAWAGRGAGVVVLTAGGEVAARAVCRCGPAAMQCEHTTSAPVYVTFSPDGNARL